VPKFAPPANRPGQSPQYGQISCLGAHVSLKYVDIVLKVYYNIESILKKFGNDLFKDIQKEVF